MYFVAEKKLDQWEVLWVWTPSYLLTFMGRWYLTVQQELYFAAWKLILDSQLNCGLSMYVVWRGLFQSHVGPAEHHWLYVALGWHEDSMLSDDQAQRQKAIVVNPFVPSQHERSSHRHHRHDLSSVSLMWTTFNPVYCNDRYFPRFVSLFYNYGVKNILIWEPDFAIEKWLNGRLYSLTTQKPGF